MRIALLIAGIGIVALSGVEAAHDVAAAALVRVVAAAPIACESLGQVTLANGTLVSTTPVRAGAFTPPGGTNPAAAAVFESLPAFCRVTLKLTPTTDSDIRVEVWLPLSGWNHKIQAIGNGGLGGEIAYPSLAAAVRAGYAAAGTDAGHVGGNADFVAGHPEKLVDFAYRAIHEMTVTAKTFVAAYYDAPPTRSYFSSCSTGGRQALIEAQRYPDDFDGIVAGDPSWDQMRLYAARVWLNVYVNRTPSAIIPPSKYPMIHRAVLDKCDPLDGVKDGVIEDPSRCSFDFATLMCAGEDRLDCLTKDQVETATAMTSPIRDPKSGAVLHPGHYYPGSELGWGGVAGPKPSGESHEGMRKIVFTPDWDYHAIKVPDDVERAVKADKGLLYGGDPNLSRFFSRGGKLLMYHGWADPLVSPDTSLIMFKRINDAVGPSAANSVALFMVPGMTHCQGGPGTDVFDKVATLDRWVESGAKPRSIVASHMTSGVVDRTRPLCAYPATAHYTGSGSTDDARNFRCQMEARSPGNTAASQDAAKTAPAPGRAVATSSATAGNVTQARVLAEAGRGDNWLVNGGNFESQHFSPLKSITDQNIGRLGLAWSLDVVSPMGLSAEPIVVDGVIYLGAPFDKVYAIDGATGRLRWQFDPHIRINGPWRNSYEGRKNRGVAVWNGKVYVGTGDCRMVAIDAASGKAVWDTPVCDADQTGITEAPRVGDGKVFTGWAGMEYDVRGGVVALDAETGKKAWTFWTTPGDPSKPYESKTLEAAARTWDGESWKLGGANVWTAMTYDVVTNLLLFGTSTTGEPVGDLADVKSSGSRLFANSIVAVNASTGQYVWHYQTATPPSGAEEFHILVANIVVNGKDQRVVMTVPRNGVFYTLDARTGKAILPPGGIDGTAVPPLKQIDLSAVSSRSSGDAEANQAIPSPSIGHAWFPMGYNPQTGLVYIPAYETLGRFSSQGRGNGQAPTQGPALEADRLAGRDNGQGRDLAHGKLVAFDPIKQTPRWVVTLPLSVNGGVLATAGNLVFHGDASGEFSSYAADTGKKLWSVKTGSAIQSVPVTYLVNGEQYVLMPIGLGGGFRLFGRVSDMATLESKRGQASLLVFKLDGKATVPSVPPTIPAVPKPPEQTASPEKIQQGARVYTKFFCHKCHSPDADGSGAWSLDGEVPDLRYMPLGVHQRFNAIVLGGSNQRNGMPKYSTPPGWPWVKTAMTQEEADALHAYLIDVQWKTYRDGPRGLKSAEK